MSELVRVKDKFQVTIPRDIRMAAAIEAGDYLEISAVAEGILMRPRRVVAKGKPVRTILDYLRESRGVERSKADIDAVLNQQRDEW